MNAWFVKSVGAALTLAGTLALSSYLDSGEKKRLETLIALIALIRYMRGRIDPAREPIADILSSYKSEPLAESGFCDSDTFGGRLAKCRCKPSGEAGKLLDEFAAQIGLGEAKEQAELCDYYVGRLVSEADAQSQKLAKSQKLRRSVMVMAALLVIIILI